MICLDKIRPIRVDRTQYAELERTVLQRDGWRCQACGTRSHLEVTTNSFAAGPETTRKRTSSLFVTVAMPFNMACKRCEKTTEKFLSRPPPQRAGY
jgi:hypothetical protein